MASNDQRIVASLLAFSCAFALACGSEESSGGGFPIGQSGTGGAGGGGAGGVGGQGGVSGVQGPMGGAAGVAGLGGAGGVAGVGGAGGVGGIAGGGAGGTGGMVGGAGGMGGTGGGGAGGTGGSAPSGEICAQWKEANANLDEGAWNGSTSSCDAGSMSADALAKAHALHSLYRTMAGLEPVEMTDEGNQLAQECAMMMTANGTITHQPPSSWDCYSEERADTAGTSSLSSGGALDSVGGYMVDPGNPTTLGHRRWILANMLASIGFGSTGSFSCQYQPAKWSPGGTGGKAWAAWPPEGQIPIQAFGAFFAKLDQTGWSVQSDTIDLNDADVTITSDGAELAVNVTSLLPGYGSQYAISIIPSGWTAAAGKTYHVAISGVSPAIEYDVEVVDCP